MFVLCVLLYQYVYGMWSCAILLYVYVLVCCWCWCGMILYGVFGLVTCGRVMHGMWWYGVV